MTPPTTDQESPAAPRAIKLANPNDQKAHTDSMAIIDQQERTRVTHLPRRHEHGDTHRTPVSAVHL